MLTASELLNKEIKEISYNSLYTIFFKAIWYGNCEDIAKLYTNDIIYALPENVNTDLVNCMIDNYSRHASSYNIGKNKVIEYVIKHETTKGYEIIHNKLSQMQILEPIKSLLNTMSLAEKLVNIQDLSGDELTGYSYTVQELIKDEIAKTDFIERVQLNIELKHNKSHENFEGWWCNVTKILPKEVLSKLEIPNFATSIEIADYEAIIAYKAGFTNELALYKIIYDSVNNDSHLKESSNKTLEFYKRLYKDDQIALDIIGSLQEQRNLDKKEKITCQKYILEKSKDGLLYSQTEQTDLIKLYLKNPDLDEIVKKLKNNYNFSNAIHKLLNTIYKKYTEYKKYIEANPMIQEVITELILERDDYKCYIEGSKLNQKLDTGTVLVGEESLCASMAECNI